MNIASQLAVIFVLCLAGEGIAQLLPVAFPASVIAMLLLLVLLLSGAVKPRHVEQSANFLLDHMSLFFVPASVGIIQYLDILKGQLIPFLVIAALTTPLVFCATAWTVQLMIRLGKRGGGRHE